MGIKVTKTQRDDYHGQFSVGPTPLRVPEDQSTYSFTPNRRQGAKPQASSGGSGGEPPRPPKNSNKMPDRGRGGYNKGNNDGNSKSEYYGNNR